MQVKRQRLAARPEIILEAAAAVLLKGGVRGLTIDAVAVEAGLSKGGVLHHYASKDALVAEAKAVCDLNRMDLVEFADQNLPKGATESMLKLGEVMISSMADAELKSPPIAP